VRALCCVQDRWIPDVSADSYVCLWLAFIIPVLGVNFDTCLADVRSGRWGEIGGTDNHGRPISNISTATAITYELCVVACGSGQADFQWNIFSQQFRWVNFTPVLASALTSLDLAPGFYVRTDICFK
jgi:hypothetical protein